MWRKIGRVIGVIFGWGVILAYILYASHLAQVHRAEQKVAEVVISISDSTATQLFATSEQIGKQLQRGGFKLKDCVVDSVDAVKISDYIARNGFVEKADVYATYSGKVYIDVKQHEPVVRLLCGGLNSYVTSEGKIFRSPRNSAYYAPVVTGSYRPMFTPTYEGDMASHYASLCEVEDAKLSALGEEFVATKQKRNDCVSRKSELRKEGKKGIFESEEKHRQRKVGIEVEINECNEQLRKLSSKIANLERQQQRVELRKKKFKKRYADFSNLINFVAQIGEESFWRAEIVQIVADTTSTGEISLRLVPRSGDFVVEFGTLEDSDEKLSKLRNFYDKGLSHIGWNSYKKVDLRYNNQVICTK